MGKVIKNKIRGLSWGAKISLILCFSLLFSVFMYQGWYKPLALQAVTVGPNTAGSATGSWTTPTNPTTSNNAYATYAGTAQAVLTLKTFGFSIPAGAVIQGVTVTVEGNGIENNQREPYH